MKIAFPTTNKKGRVVTQKEIDSSHLTVHLNGMAVTIRDLSHGIIAVEVDPDNWEDGIRVRGLSHGHQTLRTEVVLRTNTDV